MQMRKKTDKTSSNLDSEFPIAIEESEDEASFNDEDDKKYSDSETDDSGDENDDYSEKGDDNYHDSLYIPNNSNFYENYHKHINCLTPSRLPETSSSFQEYLSKTFTKSKEFVNERQPRHLSS